MERGNLIEALKRFESTTKYSPYNIDSWCHMGRINLDFHRGYVIELVARAPVGAIYKNDNQLQRAVECYERALAINPNAGPVNASMSVVLNDLASQVREGDSYLFPASICLWCLLVCVYVLF